MQAINVSIVRSPFIPIFVGTAAALAIATIAAFVSPTAHGARLAIGAAAFACFAGVIGVTATQNIPLNDGLAAFSGSEPQAIWTRYYSAWMRWNHLRAFFSAVSFAALVVALRARR